MKIEWYISLQYLIGKTKEWSKCRIQYPSKSIVEIKYSEWGKIWIDHLGSWET